jgi:hypothetical protein
LAERRIPLTLEKPANFSAASILPSWDETYEDQREVGYGYIYLSTPVLRGSLPGGVVCNAGNAVLRVQLVVDVAQRRRGVTARQKRRPICE